MDISSLTELERLIARHGTLDGAAFRVLPNVTIMSSLAPTPPIAEITEPMFALVAQGKKHVGLGDRIFGYGTAQYLIVSVDLPLEAHVAEATPEAPYLGLGFTLRPEAIAALLLEVGTGQAARLRANGQSAYGGDGAFTVGLIRLQIVTFAYSRSLSAHQFPTFQDP